MNRQCIAPKPGLRGAKVFRCKCADCSAASREHATTRNRLVAYGRWQPYIDAEPVRRHVRTLMAAGLGKQRIAALADVTPSVVSRLLYGRPGCPPSKQIRPANAERLLAIQATIAATPDGATTDACLIDATGTRRRICALAAIGWSLAAQAGELGRLTSNYAQILTRGSTVQASTARAVADLYVRWSATAAPASLSASKARMSAERKGWAPPWAWDDDTIDNPEAEPYGDLPDSDSFVDRVRVERALDGHTMELNALERHYAVHLGQRWQMTHNAIALAIGMSLSTARALAAKPLPEDCEVAA